MSIELSLTDQLIILTALGLSNGFAIGIIPSVLYKLLWEGRPDSARLGVKAFVVTLLVQLLVTAMLFVAITSFLIALNIVPDIFNANSNSRSWITNSAIAIFRALSGLAVALIVLATILLGAGQHLLADIDERRLRLWMAYLKWLVARGVVLIVLVMVPLKFIGEGRSGGPPHLPESFSEVVRWILVGTPFLVLMLSVFQRWGNSALREWKQLSSPDAKYVLSTDLRPPIIYLRSFRDDGMEVSLERWRLGFVTYEIAITNGLKAFGPCIAVGKPGERLPELGAAKLYVSDDEWQKTVSDLLSKAQFVVFNVLSLTPGVQWEIEHAFKTLRAYKIVLLFPWPNRSDTEIEERERAYSSVKQMICGVTALKMPDTLADGSLISFGKDNSVIVIGEKQYPQSRQIEQYVEALVWHLKIEMQSQGTRNGNSSYAPNILEVAAAAIGREPRSRKWVIRRRWCCFLGIVAGTLGGWLDLDYRMELEVWKLIVYTDLLFLTAVLSDIATDAFLKGAATQLQRTGDKVIYGLTLAKARGSRSISTVCMSIGLISLIILFPLFSLYGLFVLALFGIAWRMAEKDFVATKH
jgi:hypothetical protein